MGASGRRDPSGPSSPANPADSAEAPGRADTSGQTAASGSADTSGPADTSGQTAASGSADTSGPADTSGQTGASGPADARGGLAAAAGEADRQRRRRRLTVIAVSVGAALVVIALCAGALGVISAVHRVRDDAADARESRRLRNADCLELETRLNHLTPPGAATSPAARATAIQDENAAVRIYIMRIGNQRDGDAWRQLVDARTTYAESLQQQAKARTPAFYVAPRTGDGIAVADQLDRWSPAPCAGPIRRLAAPDL
jgi:hypothetical protein